MSDTTDTTDTPDPQHGATVWIRHPDIDGITEVPASALPHYRLSGWDEAPKTAVKAHEKAVADEQAAAAQAMDELAARNTVDTPGVDTTPTSEES